MKVGLFIGSIAPADGGGYSYVAEVLAALDRSKASSGHDFVLCHHRGGEAVARLFPSFQALGLDAQKASVLSPKEKLFQLFPGVAERLFNRAFFIPAQPSWDERLYVREGIQFLIRLVPWNAMTMNLPFAAVLWDLQHRTSPWFPEVSASGQWEGREASFSLLLRRASIIYTGTQRGRREIELFYQVPEDRIKVLPFAVPDFAAAASGTLKNEAVLHRLEVPADYIFYPAQFWPHKNHVLVLDACKLIRQRTGWDLNVVFVGSDKSNLDYIRGYARRIGIDSNLHILGFVDRNDLVQLYKGAFCLTYSTYFGPDNLPPLEAFALGCPVVASDVPGAKEQLGDAALLYPPSDAEALANAILSLRDKQLRAKMIAAGRAAAAKTSWDDYARGIIASLDEFAPIRRAWP